MADYRFSEMSREELEQQAEALLAEARESACIIHRLEMKLRVEKTKSTLTKNVLKFRHGRAV